MMSATQLRAENPSHMLSNGGSVRGSMGAGSDGMNRAAASTGVVEKGMVAHEIELLLRGKSRYESLLAGGRTLLGAGGRDLPQRSGSAPPSVEGSRVGLGGFYGQSVSGKDGHLSGSLRTGLGSGGHQQHQDSNEVLDSEHELRSDPAYFAYWQSHHTLNPRLPQPLISWDNYRLAQLRQAGIAAGGGLGEKKRIRALGEETHSKSLFSTQPVLPTHTEEEREGVGSEDEGTATSSVSTIQRVQGILHRTTSGSDWLVDRNDNLLGLTGASARPKSLVDLIQEDFPRTPSPVYNNQSRASSRAAVEDPADAVGNSAELIAHLRDGGIGASDHCNGVVVNSGTRSGANTPKPGSALALQSLAMGSVVAPAARIPSPAPMKTSGGSGRVQSPGLVASHSVLGQSSMAGVSGLAAAGNGVSVANGLAATAAELAAALQSFQISGGVGQDAQAAAQEVQDLMNAQQKQQQHHQQQHHQQQQQQHTQHYHHASHHHEQQTSQEEQQLRLDQQKHHNHRQQPQQQQQQQQQQQRILSLMHSQQPQQQQQQYSDSGYRSSSGSAQAKYGGMSSTQSQVASSLQQQQQQQVQQQVQVQQQQAAAAVAAPNVYAAAAAMYTMAGSPYYQNVHAAAMYNPQYAAMGLGAYPITPAAMMAPMIAGYPPSAALSMGFDNAAAAAAAAAAAGMGVRTSSSIPGSAGMAVGNGAPMHHLYKFGAGAGAAGAMAGPSTAMADPMYMAYIQRAAEEARVVAAAGMASDPSVLRGYMGGGGGGGGGAAASMNQHGEMMDLPQKSQMGSGAMMAPLGTYGSSEQKVAAAAAAAAAYPRSGTMVVPVATVSKGGSVSPGYYGSPPGVGLMMSYPGSTLSNSHAMQQSAVAIATGMSANVSTSVPPRRAEERSLRLSYGTEKGRSMASTAAAVAAGPTSSSSFSQWPHQQQQRVTESAVQADEPRVSSLLEDYKNSKNRRFELADIVGHVVEFSADQHGSRFIQQKLENATDDEKALVFSEVLPRALQLMTDVFGNYVIQKFFEHGSQSQRRELANQLLGHVLALSLQMYGCRVIQKALEVVDVEQQTMLVAELDGHVMRCVRDQNGNHVIQKCIECVPADRIQFIVQAFYGQVVCLSTHPYGCRVIQRVLEHCSEKQKNNGIMEEILRATCVLAQDQYGNYVIQHVLERGTPEERSEIITKLAGQIVQMSQHKFASNVVEKCLEHGGAAERQILINEMLGQTDENEPLQAMMKDQFANYVVQKVLDTCDDVQRELLLGRIKVHLHALRKYTYGKHIVARVEKLVSGAAGKLPPRSAEHRADHRQEVII